MSERMDRIEANLDKVTSLLIETAERQSTNEYQIAQLSKAVTELRKAVEIDAENIRRLANIASAL